MQFRVIRPLSFNAQPNSQANSLAELPVGKIVSKVSEEAAPWWKILVFLEGENQEGFVDKQGLEPLVQFLVSSASAPLLIEMRRDAQVLARLPARHRVTKFFDTSGWSYVSTFVDNRYTEGYLETHFLHGIWGSDAASQFKVVRPLVFMPTPQAAAQPLAVLPEGKVVTKLTEVDEQWWKILVFWEGRNVEGFVEQASLERLRQFEVATVSLPLLAELPKEDQVIASLPFGHRFTRFEASANDAWLYGSTSFEGQYLEGYLERALLTELPVVQHPLRQPPSNAADWPSPPSFFPLSTNEARQRIFGRFSYVPAPTRNSPENIRITDDWAQKNIETFVLPQLVGVLLDGKPHTSGRISFNKRAKRQLLALWKAWEDEGLLKRVLTYEGAFDPRFVRGGVTDKILSNHAFGIAFDINRVWNDFGQQPALFQQKGCVRELVQIAYDFGFYWGGHFKRKPDGMHFEVAQPWD